MDYEVQNKTNYYLYGTEVDNLFLGEFMLDAPGDYVKVYLLALMYANIKLSADNLMLSKQLGMPLELIDRAWDYWAEKHMVRKLESAPGSYRIEFLNLRELIFGHCASDTLATQKAPAPINFAELDRSEFYSSIEKITGRMLERNEPEVFARWITELGIDPELIKYCYKYSTESASSNRYRYVEKILLDWYERGIKTPEEAAEYLGDKDRQTVLNKAIFKELGFRRNPTEEEKRIMKSWADDMGYGLDKIKEACKKTASLSNPSIKYVDAVLRAWYNEAHADADAIDDKNINAYNRIQQSYARIRKENAGKSEKLRAEILTKAPHLRDIMDRLKGCGYETAQAMLSGNTRAIEAIREKQRRLTKEKERVLVENGYAPEALDPIYTCNKCKDTGVLEDGTACTCYGEKLQLLINDR